MNIKPVTLKYLRNRLPMSQDDLAAASTVTKKTIGEIERGKRNNIRANTIKNLAKALNVEPDDLAKNPDEISFKKSKDNPSGYRKIAESISGDTHINFDMVQVLYGISRKTQIETAPLLMALMAEASLNWRREKLDKITEASDALSDIAKGHLSFANAVYRVDEGADAEDSSINRRDFFGREIPIDTYELGYDPDTHNPFADYLRDFAEQISCKHINLDLDELWINANGMPDYSIGIMEFHEITGGDKWAGYALRHGLVRIQDIPKELMAKEKRDERVKWLAGHVSPEERKRIDDESRKFFESIGLSPEQKG